MADLMAIVSKAVFEKAAGKAPKLGTRLEMDRYVSANKNLEPLAANGRLYLVTVRPPNEALWLVAVLDKPKFDGAAWISKPCDKPIIDISALKSKLKFESGKGISAAAGALGMSLQTPRALTTADTALLDAAYRGAPVESAAAAEESAVAPETDRRALLLAAVIADPENLAPRQVYADELTTHGDPRGEFILLEIALDGGLSIRKREQLEARHAELKKAHAASWWPYKISYRTHAGFLTFVGGPYKQLATLAPKLFASEPIVDVSILGVDPEENADKIIKAKWLANLHALALRGSIGDEGFASLCASKLTAKLRSLNVTANELSAEALANLGDGLPACRTLVLTANPIGDEGISALRAWKHLDKVEMLYLSNCELSNEGVSELVSQPLPALRKLCLTRNGFDDGVASAFTKYAKNLPQLRHLELISVELGTAGAKAIAKAALPNLVRLDVRRNAVDERAVKDLAPRVRAG